MRLIDGKAVAATVAADVREAVAKLGTAGVVPTLAVVVPTADESTAWYVRSIVRTAERVGVRCLVDELPGASGEVISQRLAELSADPGVHGVICQTPLPDGVGLERIGGFIDPAKDIDGANPASLGRLAAGLPAFAPATAAAVMTILRHEKVALSGVRAAVVGRSTVVGKPTALLLLAENATVTVCHSRTRDLPAVCAEADLLVVAVGRAKLIGAAHVRPDAVVIDVGTNPTPDGGLVGDVDAEAVAGRAGALTPVPGGVGPVTTMVLMHHTVTAAAGLTG